MRGCKDCKRVRRPKHTHQQIFEYFADRGYTLVTDVYLSSKQKLTVVCPKGHVIETVYNNFSRGIRCHQCDVVRRYLLQG